MKNTIGLPSSVSLTSWFFLSIVAKRDLMKERLFVLRYNKGNNKNKLIANTYLGISLFTVVCTLHVSFHLFIYFCFIYLFYFTILYWFCHALTWICHGCTCVPHPEPPLPPPSPSHPSGSSQCTSPEYPVSCIEPGLVIHFIYDNTHVSMPFSHIIPPSPSPTESRRLFYTSVSLLLSCIQGCHYHLYKFHIYALVYCIGVFLSGLLHSV